MEFGFLTGDNGFYSYFSERYGRCEGFRYCCTVTSGEGCTTVYPCRYYCQQADGKDISMTYYVPVQWTRINMPVIGAVASVSVDAAKDAIS